MAKTLGSTINQLLDEIDRTGQFTSQAATYINQAIEHYQDKPFKFNEQIATANTHESEEYLDLPTDWGEEVGISIAYDSNLDYVPLNYRTMSYMDDRYSTSRGRPCDYTIFRQQIRLGPIPDSSSYSVKMTYRVRPATATAAAQTNIMIQNANDLIRAHAGALMAAIILNDDEVAARMGGMEAREKTRHQSEYAIYAMRGSTRRRR